MVVAAKGIIPALPWLFEIDFQACNSNSKNTRQLEMTMLVLGMPNEQQKNLYQGLEIQSIKLRFDEE